MDYYDEVTAEPGTEWIGSTRHRVVRVELTYTDTDRTREVLLSVDAAAELRDAIALVLDEVSA